MGWTRKVLRVDLTNGTCKAEPLNMEWAQQYLGQRGLATKYFVSEVDPKVDPLSPENKLIMATLGKEQFEDRKCRIPLGDTVLRADLHKLKKVQGPTGAPRFVAESDGGVTVVLDTNLTEALIAEGYAREIVSKVQTMRKDAGFEVTDRISIGLRAGDALRAAVEGAREDILAATLATTLSGEAPEGVAWKAWNINGEAAEIAVWPA